jgi:hypothetical protein
MAGQGAAAGVGNRALPFKLAHRIAVNRTIAGVHFPVDSAAGALLGCAIGEAVHALATGGRAVRYAIALAIAVDGAVDGAAPDPTQYGATQDFSLDWLGRALGAGPALAQASGKLPLLGWLWDEAAKEWA